jgi:hypothetical protein
VFSGVDIGCRPRQHGLDLRFDRVGRERLDDVAVDPCLERLYDVVLRGVGRHHQQWNVLDRRERPHGLDEFDAAHLGHVPVGDDHVHRAGIEPLQAFLAVLRLLAILMPELVQRVDDDAAHRARIVHNQKTHARPGS